MRLFSTVLLVMLAAMANAAATYDITASPQLSINGGFSLTSTETTIVLTKAVPEARVVQITCDQAFGVATATGVYATKQPVAANGTYTVTLDADTTTIYVQAASTTGTCRVSVLDRVQRN